MRPTFIAGNWKMHKTPSEAVSFVRQLAQHLSSIDSPTIEVAIAPPFVALSAVAQTLADSPCKLAAQNMFWEPAGAFTGEVSGAMLKDLGCDYVILGHSERRQLFHETNKDINRKVHAALQYGLEPILCVGERLEERESGQTESVLTTQILSCLSDVSPDSLPHLTIAYEPIWAIGTGRAATVEQAASVHRHIRSTIVQTWGGGAMDIRLLYGGSVTPDNTASLFSSPDINGALVGKACLDVDSFVKIISVVHSSRSSF